MGTLSAAKQLNIQHNVSLRVLDCATNKVVQEHTGHNCATNGLLTGIGHYLAGEGVLNQGSYMLSQFVPRYISLGTMGLEDQVEGVQEEVRGLPLHVGSEDPYPDMPSVSGNIYRLRSYLEQLPGYGADGYDETLNNGRAYAGLGPWFPDRPDSSKTVSCELVSETFPRVPISYREIVPEYESSAPKTIEVVYSALISTGALASFREEGKNYIFITEAGLWGTDKYSSEGYNSLLAGYRIAPPNKANWYIPQAEGETESDWEAAMLENYHILQENILRVGVNQVVQVIWKIQLGVEE